MPLRRPVVLALLATVLALAAWSAAGARSATAQLDITLLCTPAPADCGGWYTGDVALRWLLNPRVEEGTRVLSGCVDQTLSTDTKGTIVWCEAVFGTDQLRRSKTIRLDKTAPTVTGATPGRPPDANGWYRSPVRVTFAGGDATSGLRGCTATTYAGPDSGAAAIDGACLDVAGNRSRPLRFRLRFDATAPDITGATPSRAPDHDGWFNRPVTWSFQAADAPAGIAECPPVAYGGAASAAATITATCRDKAGNVATRSFTFRYDATAPVRPVVRAVPRDRSARLRIAAAADVTRIVVTRIPGRRGRERSVLHRGLPADLTDGRVRNGRRYRYTVTAFDQAGNSSRRRAAAIPGPRLLSPRRGTAVGAPPRLDWSPVRRASFYNVQLFRGDRKILTAWPSRSHLQLQRRWRFAGRRHELAPGRYRWMVWPAYGTRSAPRYGDRIGRRTFVVTG